MGRRTGPGWSREYCSKTRRSRIAGTYDERMYEELRLGAQTFEVPTGGKFAADHADGQDDIPKAQGKEVGVTALTLPSG